MPVKTRWPLSAPVSLFRGPWGLPGLPLTSPLTQTNIKQLALMAEENKWYILWWKAHAGCAVARQLGKHQRWSVNYTHGCCILDDHLPDSMWFHWSLVALQVMVILKCMFIHLVLSYGNVFMPHGLKLQLITSSHGHIHYYLGQDYYAGSHSGNCFASRHFWTPKYNYPKFWFPDLRGLKG